MLHMRGKLLFFGTAGFMCGILLGTLEGNFPLSLLFVTAFIGSLCVTFSYIEFLRTTSSLLSTNSGASSVVSVVAGVVLLLFSIGALRAALAPHAAPPLFAAYIKSRAPVSLNGTIIDDPDIREKNQQLIVSVSKSSPTGHTQQANILVFAPLFQHFAYGERIQFTGTLTAPTPFTTDTGRIFRYDNYLAKKSVFVLMQQPDISEISPSSGFWDYIANALFFVKHTFIKGLSRAIPSPYAQLATGLLTGDQHSLTDQLITLLSVSGLIWIVVLSGYHITLISEGILKLCSPLPRRFAYSIAVASIASIVFATGASAPSLRGALMAALTLLARATHRSYDALRALAASIILILLWNPFLLAYDSGFQLSIVVTPAIILGVPFLEKRMLWIKSAFLREVIAVSVVAQLACLPLILLQTGQLSPYAILANLFVMWLVPFALFASAIAGAVGVALPLLAPLAGIPAYAVLYYMLFIAKLTSLLPFSSIVLPAV